MYIFKIIKRLWGIVTGNTEVPEHLLSYWAEREQMKERIAYDRKYRFTRKLLTEKHIIPEIETRRERWFRLADPETGEIYVEGRPRIEFERDIFMPNY